MMLIDASWPSNSEAAVTNRTLWVIRYSASFLASDRSVMRASPAGGGTVGAPAETVPPATPGARVRARPVDAIFDDPAPEG